MDDRWKLGYKIAVMDAFLRRSTPVSLTPSYYGWIHDEWDVIRKHLRSCGLEYDECSMPEDVSWSEFGGTFTDHDNDRIGLDAVVTCSCGHYSGIRMRMTGSFSELLMAVLRED